KYLGLGCLLYALVYVGWRQAPLDLFATPQARWFVVLTGLSMASFQAMGPPMPLALSPLMVCLSFLVLFFVTGVTIDSIERLHHVLLVAVASMGLASLYVLREWQKADFSWLSRPGWVTGDPNYFTLSALLFLPVAFALIRREQSVLERALCTGTLLLTFLA